MKKLVFLGGLLAIYAVWLVIDYIRNKGKSMPRVMLRAIILFFLIAGFLILVKADIPILINFDNSAFIIITCAVLLVMIGLFVAPHINLKKGTPEFQLIIGCIIFLLISAVAITILVVTKP